MKIHCLKLTNYYCLYNSIAYIASPLASYFLQQSTSSLLCVSLTHLLFTLSLLPYCLNCPSLYLYQLYVSVSHLFTTFTSTLTLYGLRLPPLCYTFHLFTYTLLVLLSKFISLLTAHFSSASIYYIHYNFSCLQLLIMSRVKGLGARKAQGSPPCDSDISI